MHVCSECAVSAHEHNSAFPSTHPNVVQSSGLDLMNHWLLWRTYYYVSFNLATSARSSSACAIALRRTQQDLPASLVHLHLSQFLALLARHVTQFVLGFGNDPDRRVSFLAMFCSQLCHRNILRPDSGHHLSGLLASTRPPCSTTVPGLFVLVVYQRKGVTISF